MKKLNTKKMLFMMSFIGATPLAFSMIQEAKGALTKLGIPSDLLDNVNQLKSKVVALAPQAQTFGEQLLAGNFTLLENLLSSPQLDLRPFLDTFHQALPKIKSFIEKAINSKTISSMRIPNDLGDQVEKAIALLKTNIYLLDELEPMINKIRPYTNIPEHKSIILGSLRNFSEMSQYAMLKSKLETLQKTAEYRKAQEFITSINMNDVYEGVALIGKVINGESIPTASLQKVIKASEKLRHLPAKLLIFVKNNIDVIDTIDDHLAQAGILNRLPADVKAVLPQLKNHAAKAITMIENSNAQIDSLMEQAKKQLMDELYSW